MVGALLDAEAADEFVNNLILSVRSLIPVEQLCAEVEKRNRWASEVVGCCAEARLCAEGQDQVCTRSLCLMQVWVKRHDMSGSKLPGQDQSLSRHIVAGRQHVLAMPLAQQGCLCRPSGVLRGAHRWLGTGLLIDPLRPALWVGHPQPLALRHEGSQRLSCTG